MSKFMSYGRQEFQNQDKPERTKIGFFAQISQVPVLLTKDGKPYRMTLLNYGYIVASPSQSKGKLTSIFHGRHNNLIPQFWHTISKFCICHLSANKVSQLQFSREPPLFQFGEHLQKIKTRYYQDLKINNDDAFFSTNNGDATHPIYILRRDLYVSVSECQITVSYTINSVCSVFQITRDHPQVE